MAEKNTNAKLCESVAGESILNVTQDSLISTNIDAVSYTHLDVYKRQIVLCTNRLQ